MGMKSSNTDSGLIPLIKQANQGDADALEELVRRIQDPIYGLAIRMLYNPFDAEDATQEILIKIITHLSEFKEQYSFRPWMLRIATNHLLNYRRSAWEQKKVSFEQFESEIVHKAGNAWRARLSEQQQALIIEEIKISCLQGLLLCLDRDHRVSYILTEIFEVTGRQGGDILNISPAAFRKRSSRARARIRDFMLNNCSLMNADNPCHCEKEAAQAVEWGEVDPDNLVFANHPCRVKNDRATKRRLKELDEMERISLLFKDSPNIAPPDKIADRIKRIIAARKYEIIEYERLLGRN